jgi:ISXO2 transposase-like protein
MVSDKISLLATDESRVYDGLTEYNRQTVDHRRKQHVIGAVHANAIEDFWSIFKRGIVGSFHKVSAKYICRCISRSFSSATAAIEKMPTSSTRR